MILRPYQERLISDIRESLQRGSRRVLAVAPTGAGKTVCFAYMTARAAERGKRTWIIVHRSELVDQCLDALTEAGADVAAIAAGYPARRAAAVQVCSIQTLANRHERYPRPDVIILDEAHHAAAKTWADLLSAYSTARAIGFTATPVRLDGKGLGEFFDAMVLGPQTGELIDAGYLSPYRAFEPTLLDVSKLRARAGDYAKDDVAQMMESMGAKIYGDMVSTYRKNPALRRAVVFTFSVAEAGRIAAAFNEEGVPAEVLDGGLSREIRRARVARFRAGDTAILTTVDLISEGFDLPAMEGVFLGRPTASLGLYRQQVGRVLRTHPGKECAWIYDHVGNIERHGLPDADIPWVLTRDRIRFAGDAYRPPPARRCKGCFAMYPAGRAACPYCGMAYVGEEREYERVESEMRQIQAMRDPEQLRLGFARTLGEVRRMMG